MSLIIITTFALALIVAQHYYLIQIVAICQYNLCHITSFVIYSLRPIK
jgi:hypothetical protein